jgi:hypothetical protein
MDLNEKVKKIRCQCQRESRDKTTAFLMCKLKLKKFKCVQASETIQLKEGVKKAIDFVIF